MHGWPGGDFHTVLVVDDRVFVVWEFVGDDLYLKGTKSFIGAVEAKEDEEIVFGWVVFPSKAIRDLERISIALPPLRGVTRMTTSSRAAHWTTRKPRRFNWTGFGAGFEQRTWA